MAEKGMSILEDGNATNTAHRGKHRFLFSRRIVTRSMAVIAIGFGTVWIAIPLFVVSFQRLFGGSVADEIHVDTTTQWSRYFFEETGYPVLRIERTGRHNYTETFRHRR